MHTTAKVNAARFSAVGVGVMLPIILLLVSPFPLKINAVAFPTKDKCCPFFGWYRRSVAQFTAVGAAFHTTVRVNAACFSAVGVGVMLPILLLLVPPLTQRRGYVLPVFRPLA